MPMRRATNPDSPRPFNCERRTDFLKRFVSDQWVKTAYPTVAKSTLAAEREWLRAKRDSLISVTTSVDQFLLFY